MKYSVCASALYGDLPLQQSIPRIRAAGFEAFEFWSWWDQDLDTVDAARRQSELSVAAMCTRFIPLTEPARREAYIQGVRDSIGAARRLDCPTLISQVGSCVPGVSREEQHCAIVEGLRACAPMLEASGVVLAVEPLNTLVDHKGYFLDRSDEGLQIVREVDSPGVKLLFDIYHQQITEGNLIANLRACATEIAHVHIAGNPGRHEPYENSEVHYPTVIKALADMGYDGCVGLEYFPLRDPDESLMALCRQMPL